MEFKKKNCKALCACAPIRVNYGYCRSNVSVYLDRSSCNYSGNGLDFVDIIISYASQTSVKVYLCLWEFYFPVFGAANALIAITCLEGRRIVAFASRMSCRVWEAENLSLRRSDPTFGGVASKKFSSLTPIFLSEFCSPGMYTDFLLDPTQVGIIAEFLLFNFDILFQFLF